MSVLDRWRDFRRAQRDALRASNHPHLADESRPSTMELLADVLTATARGRVRPRRRGRAPARRRRGGTPLRPGRRRRRRAPEAARGRRAPLRPRRATAQPPVARSTWASSGPSACSRRCCIWNVMGRLTTTLTLVVVAFFLTLALNPLVEWLTRQSVAPGPRGRRGLRRRRRRLRPARPARRAARGVAGQRPARRRRPTGSTRSSTPTSCDGSTSEYDVVDKIQAECDQADERRRLHQLRSSAGCSGSARRSSAGCSRPSPCSC